MDPEKPKRMLVLHIEVPGIWADDLDESAALYAEGDPSPTDYLDVVVEEWLEETVGLTVISLPALKELASDGQLHAYEGRIVGAETKERR
jgi:hypothetical protein